MGRAFRRSWPRRTVCAYTEKRDAPAASPDRSLARVGASAARTARDGSARRAVGRRPRDGVDGSSASRDVARRRGAATRSSRDDDDAGRRDDGDARARRTTPRDGRRLRDGADGAALTIDPEKAAKKAAKLAEKEAKRAKAAAKAARAAEEKARTDARLAAARARRRREKKASGPSEEDARALESALKTPRGEMKDLVGTPMAKSYRSGGGGGGVVRLVGAVRDVYADDGDE